jgi:hypothetical protein
MRSPKKYAIVGFLVGIAVAVCLLFTQNGYAPPLALYVLWPTAIFGWCESCANRSVLRFGQWILAFVGNGVIYAIAAYVIGLLLSKFKRKTFQS